MLDAVAIVPEALRGAWRTYWPDADPDVLAADVVARTRAAIAVFGLRDARPLPGGNVAAVLAAEAGADGAPVVLKVNPRGHAGEAELAGQVRALRLWAPSGVVPEVLGETNGGLTLLLARAVPGVALDDQAERAARPWQERLAVIGGLAARLHAVEAPTGGFPRIKEYGPDWWEDLRGAPDELRELKDLVKTTKDTTLLHADLHGGNVLRDGDGWLVIDPHAVAGDPCADVWALIDPLAPPEVTRADVEVYARAAAIDPERAARWTRVRARAEARAIDARGAAADPDDRAWAARLHATADALTAA